MRKLSTQIFAAQLAILVLTVAIGFVLFAREERAQLDRQYEQRAASIAQAVAGVPAIISCMQAPSAPCSDVQTIASRIQDETGSSYVVVIDMNRIRHSHPITSEIGQQIEEPVVAADGLTHVRVDHGSTGPSANGIAPIFDPGHKVIGEVSVGIKESSVAVAVWHVLPEYAGWFAVALAVGALASWLLARHLKRRTFGLELDEIARLLQEREATLHGIREGMVALDESGRVTMVNDEARRLLGLGTTSLGERLDEIVPAGRLRDVLTGAVAGQDEVVLTDDYCLTVNRMPVILAGRSHGAVVTLRDRTEMSGLLRELDGVRRLSDSLRAQQHEFSNRMHTVAGLIELGHVEQALRYLTDLHDTSVELAETLRARIAAPLIVGLLLGKAAEASERGIALQISDSTWLGETPERVQAMTTILGNLIDNAFEAVAGEAGGRVEVEIVEEDHAVQIRVTDNGPGVPADRAGLIFVDGYTTKVDGGTARRGLGLALVHRLVQRLGGTITVSGGPGAVFTVSLPRTTAHVHAPAGAAP